MARGSNLTNSARAKGGRNSHGGGRARSAGSKGTSTSKSGMSNISRATRERMAYDSGE